MFKKIILIFSLFLFPIFLFADDNSNNNNNNQNVVVNINLSDELKSSVIPDGVVLKAQDTKNISFGLFDPFIGNCTNVLIDGKVYTQKVTGINLLLGYTWKNYIGNGLPLNEPGGCAYYSLGTVCFFVPMANIGYDYRFSEGVVMGVSLFTLSLTVSL